MKGVLKESHRAGSEIGPASPVAIVLAFALGHVDRDVERVVGPLTRIKVLRQTFAMLTVGESCMTSVDHPEASTVTLRLVSGSGHPD